MPSSTLNVIKEKARQLQAGGSPDDKYLKQFLYFFELRLPISTGQPISYYFPLMLAPNAVSLAEPFAVETTLTQGGGVYVEEHGIITRNLRLRGTTGFAPRPLSQTATSLSAYKGQKKSFSRSLPSAVLASISGQRHLQYLQDSVFRTYGDFKRDPSTAEGTSLIFHNPKDDEHWLVAPRNFSVDRSASRNNIYNYDIDLIVLDAAQSLSVSISEDKSLLTRLKTTLATVQTSINMVTGALQDLTALTGQLKGLIKDVAKIVDSATYIVRAAQNFVNGVTNVILAPLATINSVAELIDTSLAFLDNLENTGQQVAHVPQAIKQAFRQLGDGMDLLGLHPQTFETPLGNKVRLQGMPTATSIPALSQVTSATTTLQGIASLGTGPMPGDVTRAQNVATDPRAGVAFTGAEVYHVAQGDTLSSLAARFLGDARLWQYIAALNGLKPPFLSAQSSVQLTDGNVLTGVVHVGDTLLIPNFAQPPSEQPLIPVLGARLDAPAAAQFLGADLLLTQVQSGTAGPNRSQTGTPQSLDLALDREQGGVDFKSVSGFANIAQAVLSRVLTEQGTDILYQSVGTARTVGVGLSEVDLETARFRVQDSLNADPRIASVNQLSFLPSSTGDTILIDATLSLRGFTSSSTVQVRA